MLWAKDTALITLIYNIYCMGFSCLQASLSPLFIDLYHLSEMNARLIFLRFGVESVVAAYCSGIFSCFLILSVVPQGSQSQGCVIESYKS